jgi:hypothetical protein
VVEGDASPAPQRPENQVEGQGVHVTGLETSGEGAAGLEDRPFVSEPEVLLEQPSPGESPFHHEDQVLGANGLLEVIRSPHP